MDNTARILAAIEELGRLYCGFPWESEVWARDGHRRSPYRALVLFGLSARTKDRLLVDMCTRFFRLYPETRSFAGGPAAGEREWWGIVRAGQRPFVESAVETMARNDWQVPRDRRQIMEIKGVGDKIAECVAAYGWGEEALPMDGNGRRVVDRICGYPIDRGSSHTAHVRSWLKEVYELNRGWMTERAVAMVDIHEILRLHGQLVCARVPQCHLCPVSDCASRTCPPMENNGVTVDTGLWDEWRELLLDPIDSVPA
jgi:endonuclease III